MALICANSKSLCHQMCSIAKDVFAINPQMGRALVVIIPLSSSAMRCCYSTHYSLIAYN
jgi:hypothetical protein